MPTIQRLEIRDENYKKPCSQGVYNFRLLIENDEALVQNMVLPMLWEEARIESLGEPPVQLLTELPIAIHQAGLSIQSLSITLTPPASFTALVSDAKGLSDLSAAMQRLEEFKLYIRCRKEQPGFFSTRELEGLQPLGQYLSAMLETNSLREISLDFEAFFNDGDPVPPSFSFRTLPPSRLWKNLQSFYISEAPLHFNEVAEFLETLDHPLPSLIWNATRLLGGTWADMLDLLRAHLSKASRPAHFHLPDPSGAE
ncbi:hypothetical protein BKA64DRAFT_218049 [Cadophora sp. MPI-SDFR-AT-0126]|nr:hypothetical protein BKA64DRAFT_218049 [Leotiomycetes sp. MPI-SDFR-AT-0126]